jgi:hypothetical protein
VIVVDTMPNSPNIRRNGVGDESYPFQINNEALALAWPIERAE